MESADILDRELKKTGDFLNWLIIQPQLMTNLTDVESEKIYIINYIRIKVAETWSKHMQTQFKEKLSKEAIDGVNKLFKEFIEVDKK